MKNIIIGILVLSAFSCKAQITVYNLDVTPENRVSSNYYYKDINNHHDAIVGVWKWESGTSSFEITLQEFEMYTDEFMQANNSYRDCIYGKYKYINNDVTIAEITDIKVFFELNLYLIFRTPTKYEVIIRDIVSSKGKEGEFILTSPTTATLELWDSEGVKVNTETGIDFALPTSLVLTKQ